MGNRNKESRSRHDIKGGAGRRTVLELDSHGFIGAFHKKSVNNIQNASIKSSRSFINSYNRPRTAAAAAGETIDSDNTTSENLPNELHFGGINARNARRI